MGPRGTSAAGSRIAVVAIAALIAAGSAIATAGTAQAHTADPAIPTGLHVARATSSSVTIRVHRAAHARRYRVYLSRVKNDIFYKNIHKPRKRRHTVTARGPRITVHGLHYTTKPYYYRVVTLNHRRSSWSRNWPEAFVRPAAPTDLRASRAHGTYLSWHSMPATGFSITQASNAAFTAGVRTYHTHGGARFFTPYGLAKGRRYFFRVRARNGTTRSRPSAARAVRPASAQHALRVVSYNSLSAGFDGTRAPGGTIAPYRTKRGPAQIALLKRADADVLGIQEGSGCLVHYTSKPCYRQIDYLHRHLGSGYSLARTYTKATRYMGNYILYKRSAVSVRDAGQWRIGPGRFAAFARFRTATGATLLFATTHVISNRGSKYDAQRGSCTRSMISHANAYAAAHGVHSIVYTGDYNSYPGRPHFVDTPGKAMRANGVQDGFQVAQTKHKAQYRSINSYYRRPPTGGSEDHVYAARGVAIKSWGELLNLSHGRFAGTIPSDHNPVYSSIALP